MRIFRFLGVILLLFSFNGFAIAQSSAGAASGNIKIRNSGLPAEYAYTVLLNSSDSSFVIGTVSDEEGFFKIEGIAQGDYLLRVSSISYETAIVSLRIGTINRFVNLGNIYISELATELEDVIITGRRATITSSMERKNYSIDDNISQMGGSVLESMRNLPGITVDQDGKLYLRGSDKIIILIDGKQSALTGYGNQQALDNIPASAIERIEIINNPSARYDASGMAGVINIIFRKSKKEGWNGRLGFNAGIGNLALKKENIAAMRDQYIYTPKLNPAASVNYSKNKLNLFFNGDILWHRRLMKNEIIERIYEDDQIDQQFIENRTQPIYNVQTGLDYQPDDKNKITLSGLYNHRAYIDLGDIAYVNRNTGQRIRLWQYYEDEANETLEARVRHLYLFDQPGRNINSSFSYAFRKKDEIFNFENILLNDIGTDTFFLTAAERVFEFNTDYVHPLRRGRTELGSKQRYRIFPNEVSFIPGINSIMDPSLAGSAEYREFLSSYYANYIYETSKLEIESGLRFEYAAIDYLVDENHSIYNSEGFNYFGLFPNIRASYRIANTQNLSVFYSRRVDRPEEKNLRSFPTYADPEILSIGNPRLKPQFSNNFEIAYKLNWENGYFYSAAYLRLIRSMITTIVSKFPNSTLLAAIDQNAGTGSNRGVELVISNEFLRKLKLDLSSNVYLNKIDAFTIEQSYPSNEYLEFPERVSWSGNIKLNAEINLGTGWNIQASGIYLAPDILPQGSIGSRHSVDLGIKKSIMKGKMELFFNGSDIFNTMRIKTTLDGADLQYTSTDYYESQAFRAGFQYRF
jgi:outer membrane receptor protein involved in Fe transport